jgi:hypothetical protein
VGRIGKAAYNLRNKIIASADLTLTGDRYARVMSPEETVRLPFHPNLNMGIEYRYTPEISFWVKCNNISYNRYLNGTGILRETSCSWAEFHTAVIPGRKEKLFIIFYE